MINIPWGNDFALKVPIKKKVIQTTGEIEIQDFDVSSVEQLHVFLQHNEHLPDWHSSQVEWSADPENSSGIIVEVSSQMAPIGMYNIILTGVQNGRRFFSQQCRQFKIIGNASSSDLVIYEGIQTYTLDEVIVLDARGRDGLSAYELAVARGFEGTESEWMATLKGENGNGVLGVELIEQVGNVDHYRMTFTDGTYFDYTVTNSSRELTPAQIAEIASEVSKFITAGDLNAYTKTEVNNLLNSKANTSDIPTSLSDLNDDATHRTVTDTEKQTWNNKQNSIQDLSTIRSGANAGATAYQKPANGIPKTDLANDVQTSLGKADTALQSYTESDPTVPSHVKAITTTDISNWNGKQNALTFDSTPTAGSTNPVTSAGIKAYVDSATPTITMDDTPTSGSNNPVKSNGVYTALQGKQNTLTFDSTPTASSTNPVTSGGVKTALDLKANQSTTYTKTEVDALIDDVAYLGDDDGTIKKILDKQGNEVFLRTSTKAVVDENGYTAESRLQAMQDEINQAQLAVGAVPSDLTPTENSGNWVTSGGLYNALQPENISYKAQGGIVSDNVQDALDELSENLSDVTTLDKNTLLTGNYRINSAFEWVEQKSTHYYIPCNAGDVFRLTGNNELAAQYAFVTNYITRKYKATIYPSSQYTGSSPFLNQNEIISIKAPSDAVALIINKTTGSNGENNVEPLKIEKIENAIAKLKDNLGTVKSVKRFSLSLGNLNNVTGLYPANTTYYIGRSHTPRYIKNKGYITIKTLGIDGMYIYTYSSDFTYLGQSARILVSTTDGEATVSLPDSVKYFRLGIGKQIKSIDIESYWTGDDEVFQPKPSNGYQPFTFEVHPIRCNGSEDSSSLRSQYYVTTDSGMLHLPSSYKETGQPTPLIIYIHGSANNYAANSTSFPSAVPLVPEWDAAGFAQMDVDLIPDLYNDKQNNNSGGSSDDAECVIGAYKWCIEHFNIRRDGVYLMGRSRGGQAVLQTLGRYNPLEMPIIAAINNAGANAIINYGIINNTAPALWNLLCESFNLPTEERPTASGSNPLIRQDDIYNFLAANIDMWWKKASVGFLLMTDNKSEYQTPSEILQFLHEHDVSSNEYLGFLEQLRFRSPVPLRFDWCVADTVQPWNANNGRGNYSRIMKDGFVKNLSGNAEYREWPTVDTTTPSVSGASSKGHYHELYNIYNGDYTLPNGAVVTNPSMARVEWLLWCMSHDNRF